MQLAFWELTVFVHKTNVWLAAFGQQVSRATLFDPIDAVYDLLHYSVMPEYPSSYS
jgi:hypothetical protein